MTEEDDRLNCRRDSRTYGKTPEQRYQEEKNPDRGFGHESNVHESSDGRLDKGHCIPCCRFYEPIGRRTVFDILEDYKGYQQFEEVYQAYKELQKKDPCYLGLVGFSFAHQFQYLCPSPFNCCKDEPTYCRSQILYKETVA